MRPILTGVCVLLAAISVPLILRRIGPNRWYGVRTTKTHSSPEVWYPVNEFGGWALLIAATVSLAATWLAPDWFAAKLWFPPGVILVPLAVACAACLVRIRRNG